MYYVDTTPLAGEHDMSETIQNASYDETPDEIAPHIPLQHVESHREPLLKVAEADIFTDYESYCSSKDLPIHLALSPVRQKLAEITLDFLHKTVEQVKEEYDSDTSGKLYLTKETAKNHLKELYSNFPLSGFSNESHIHKQRRAALQTKTRAYTDKIEARVPVISALRDLSRTAPIETPPVFQAVVGDLDTSYAFAIRSLLAARRQNANLIELSRRSDPEIIEE